MTLIHTPNEDQVKAEDEFVDFLLDSHEKEMRLIGPGGTGKSWLVKRLITEALRIYKENCRVLGLEPDYTNYVLVALTNKAAQSLQDATGLDVVTLHSFLNLTVKANYQTGKEDLRRTSNWTIYDKYLVFIDEAYMMDPKLLDELRMATMNCKIVFVGDDKQLDPIEAVRSPIVDLKVRTAELTIPVRNSGSRALQDICQLLRDNVAGCIREAEEGIPWTWPMLPLTPGEIDHVDDHGLQSLLNTTFRQPSGNNLIVAFSNSKVNDYNNYLREQRGQQALFQPGEVLISNEMFERGRFRIKNEQTVEIAQADSFVTWMQIGDLEVPTQLVRIQGHTYENIPVVLDRDFMREAIKHAAKRAKAGLEGWDRYWQLKKDFADFRPRDASTVHKSQGSTKDLVVVDLPNIGACNFTVMAARMLYVAVSRARHRVIFYGNLPSKYGGLIF